MRERGMIANEFKEKGKDNGSKDVREKGGKPKGRKECRVSKRRREGARQRCKKGAAT
jgi:hypothetical protein